MEKEFIPYAEALALKELGFDEPCFGSYVKLTETQNTFFMNDVVDEIDRETPLHKSLITKAPLYQQAFRWFREKYSNIEFSLPLKKQKDLGVFWGGFIQTENDNFGKSYGSNFKTYEEAELECLKKLIEIVKNKKTCKQT
jgi:hypothetical protein